jgi:hypothetical protein
LYKHGGYYYLFVNWGLCCQGVNSTYNIRVGRSTSPSGPFLAQNGVNMINQGGTLFLGSSGNIIGPGQIGILAEGEQSWFSYHYYNGASTPPGNPTYNLQQLYWTYDGWPSATFVAPSADFNLDGKVDISDLLTLASHWQTTGLFAQGDATGNGFIDAGDLGILASNWQAGVSGSALTFDAALNSLGLSELSLPEPATYPVILSGAILVLGRKRRPSAVIRRNLLDGRFQQAEVDRLGQMHGESRIPA